MSSATAFAFVSTVALLAALTAFAIWRLPRLSNCCNHQHHVGGCTKGLCLPCSGHSGQQSPDHHKDCAGANHGHEELASRDHTHPQRPCQCQGDLERLQQDLAQRVTQEDLDLQLTQYVLRDELNRLIDERVERRIEQLKVSCSVSDGAIWSVLKGALFGSVVGAFVGALLAFVLLPRSVFERHFYERVFGSDQLNLLATSYDWWPKPGIVLGCAFAFMIVGMAINMFRSRRNRKITTEEIR